MSWKKRCTQTKEIKLIFVGAAFHEAIAKTETHEKEKVGENFGCLWVVVKIFSLQKKIKNEKWSEIFIKNSKQQKANISRCHESMSGAFL